MNIRTLTLRAAVVLAACGAATTLAGGLANAATPTTAPPATASAVAAGHDTSLSTGSTGITMEVVNHSGQNLTLVGASNPYGHWQHRASSMTPDQAPLTVSDYSDDIEGAEITLTFQTDDGTTITLQSDAPLAGSSTATGDSSTTAHTVTTQHTGSFHTDDTYTIN